MTQPDPLDLTIAEGAAISHLKYVFKQITSPAEKISGCLLLIERAAWLADQGKDLTDVDLIVGGKSQAFNEQIKDIAQLAMEVKSYHLLRQLAIDILEELEEQHHE
jgi:hypothetical protein